MAFVRYCHNVHQKTLGKVSTNISGRTVPTGPRTESRRQEPCLSVTACNLSFFLSLSLYVSLFFFLSISKSNVVFMVSADSLAT